MQQEFKKGSKASKEQALENLRQEFKKEQETIIESKPSEQTLSQPKTRIVKLKVTDVQECGCGGGSDPIEVWREVDYDSPLHEGDEVSEFEDDDIIIE